MTCETNRGRSRDRYYERRSNNSSPDRLHNKRSNEFDGIKPVQIENLEEKRNQLNDFKRPVSQRQTLNTNDKIYQRPQIHNENNNQGGYNDFNHLDIHNSVMGMLMNKAPKYVEYDQSQEHNRTFEETELTKESHQPTISDREYAVNT